MYDYSEEYVGDLRKIVASLRLLAPEDFWKAGTKELQEAYNGIGPETWSSVLRALVTKLLNPFEEEALIHDWEYSHAPKTRLAFSKANARFAANAVKAAWIRDRNVKKIMLRRAGLGILLALLCQCFGWSGFKNSHKKDNANETENL